MLPFGSITSVIPLSVLAIAYTLFICASALNRIKPASDVSPDKELIAGADQISAHQAAKNTIHYNDIQDVVSPETNKDAGKPPEWFSCRIILLPTEKVYSGFSAFVFSRPPPSLFS